MREGTFLKHSEGLFEHCYFTCLFNWSQYLLLFLAPGCRRWGSEHLLDEEKQPLPPFRYMCVCTEILLVKGNKCVALYRKKELVMVMESCARVCLREGVCVTGLYGRVQTHSHLEIQACSQVS